MLEAVYFFHKVNSKYNAVDYIEILSQFFIDFLNNQNAFLSAMFFLDIFSLAAPYYSRTEEDEVQYIILPALTLDKLKKRGFEISKIIGGIIQIDHQGHMGFQICQIFDYLIENNFFTLSDFINLLKLIIINEYASNIRIGRFLGMILEFQILTIKKIIEIFNRISLELNLQIKQISEFLFGIINNISSYDTVNSLINNIFKLDKPNFNFLKNSGNINDQVVGLAYILSNYLYNNKSIYHIIKFFLNINATPVLAEAFKYLMDNSILTTKRFSMVLNEEIYYKKFNFKDIALVISSNFSKSEIAKIIGNILILNKNFLDNANLLEILEGFYKYEHHRFTISDLENILNLLQKFDPYLLEHLKIENIKGFVKSIDLNISG